MNRWDEIDILAATLDEPARAFLRACVVAQRQGRLGAAAKVAGDLAAKRPALRWTSLLLALEATELRLAGAVRLTTPRTRFIANETAPVFEERWGAFMCTIWPEPLLDLELSLEPSQAGYRVRARALGERTDALDPRCQEVLRELVAELADHLAAPVSLFVESNGCRP